MSSKSEEFLDNYLNKKIDVLEGMKYLSIVKDFPIEFDEKRNQIINKDVLEFCEKMDDSHDYYEKNRNAKNAFANNLFGKKGENIAINVLHDYFGFPLKEVDYAIRKGKNKGWFADFIWEDRIHSAVHVKTCDIGTLEKCEDYSWMFQIRNASGQGGVDDIFKETERVLFVGCYTRYWRESEGKALIIAPFDKVAKYLREPKKQDLKDLKLCLYYKDLIKYKEEIEDLSI